MSGELNGCAIGLSEELSVRVEEGAAVLVAFALHKHLCRREVARQVERIGSPREACKTELFGRAIDIEDRLEVLYRSLEAAA